MLANLRLPCAASARFRVVGRIILPLACACMAAPALAQDDPAAALDLLSQQSATSAGGMALAISQSGNGDLLGAMATIDRVLMIEPSAKPALLLRALLLCRIDDRQGGSAQLARLKKRDFAKSDWAQVSAACSAPRPAATTAATSSSSPPDNAKPSQRNTRWSPPGF